MPFLRQRETEFPIINSETPEHSDGDHEEDEILPSRLFETEGGPPNQEGVHAPSSICPPSEEGQPHIYSNPFWLIDGESADQQVQRGFDIVSARPQNPEHPNFRPAKQTSAFVDRLAALETSTHRNLLRFSIFWTIYSTLSMASKLAPRDPTKELNLEKKN